MPEPLTEMVRRRRAWLLVVGLAAVTGVLLLWFRYVEPIRAHSRWFSRVRHDILKLADKRPQDVTKGQWEFAVGWTINLHGNCGSIPFSTDQTWQDDFAEELERRLAGSVTLADTEWIWDEYVRHTRYGPTYSERYRPTKAEEFAHAQEGCCGIRVK